MDNTIEAKGKIGLLTVGAIAIVAYLLSALIHEAVGHGLTAFLLGAKLKQIAGDFVDYDNARLSPWANRAVAAGGTAANLLAGALSLLWLRREKPRGANARYFLWLLGHINLFQGFGYMMVLSFASFGDWHAFVQGLEFKMGWQVGFTLFGLAGSLIAFFHSARSLDSFAGADDSVRRNRAFLLTFIPYLLGGLVNSLSAAFGPGGMLLVFISAAMATFGGTCPLVWVPLAMGPARTTTPETPFTPTRSKFWLGLGVAALAVYFFILGPGLIR